MAIQRDLEVKMIAVLYARYHEGKNSLTKNAFRKVVQDQWKVSEFRFHDAFENLRRWKYLKEECEGPSETTYRLSAHGVDWFEGWFWHEVGEGTSFTYYPLHNDTVIVDRLRRDVEREKKLAKPSQPYSSFNWTKWSAIAALIAIPIPFIIWWLS